MRETCQICESAPDTPTVFDTHDGGIQCEVCDRVFCPKCEVKFFGEESFVCDDCIAKAKLIN